MPEHITLLDPLIKDYLSHPKCTYRNGTLNSVPVETVASSIEGFDCVEPYDLLIMANVLEHCFDVPAIFERILQCLKPGGTLVLGDNAFRMEQIRGLVEKQFDAGHPIRVAEGTVTKFLHEGFAELYQQRFYGRYSQPHRIDIYFIGTRHPTLLHDGRTVLDLPALMAVEDDAVAASLFSRLFQTFDWDGKVALEAATVALQLDRIELAEALAAVALEHMPQSREAALIRQRIANFKNTFFVTVGQILSDSKMGQALRRVIGRFRPRSLLDLGAASGLGSTTVLAEGLVEHKLDARIYAVESGRDTFLRLKQNVVRFASVTPLHGNVVDATRLPDWDTVLADIRSRPNHVLEHITMDELRHWYDHAWKETKTLWGQGSVLQQIPERVFDLVVLDADLFFAREALTAVVEHANIVVLDDVTEHKNAANHDFLAAHPDWEMLDMDLQDRHGWSIFRRRHFLGGGSSAPVPARIPSEQPPRIHFVYSGEPRNDQAIRAPATITNRIYRFLEQRADIIYYDLADTQTVPDVRPNDMILGHPHPKPGTIVGRLLDSPAGKKNLIFPFHSRLPEINRFAKELAAKAQKLFLISGPYWIDSIQQTEFAAWQNKIVRLDNAVDLEFFSLRKTEFNKPGHRGMLVLGRSGVEKGTTQLFQQLRKVPGKLVVAGEFLKSDLAIFEGRPDTEFLGVLDWRNESQIARVIDQCDFFLNLSVSDASPTTLLETMAMGLVPVTTPQCGYTYPSLIPLSLSDEEHNLVTLRNLQLLPQGRLESLKTENRGIIERYHSWNRFLASLWTGLCSDKPLEQGEKTPRRSANAGARRAKVAADYNHKADLTQIDSESEFARAIRRVFKDHRPRRIVETGTYLGEGTTRVIASSLREESMADACFHSIEINPKHLARARENLSRQGLESRVNLHLGLSVPRRLLPSMAEIEQRTVRGIEEDDLFVDHRELERAALYYKETDYGTAAEDLLGKVIRGFNGCPDFVLLDSGGHLGNVEFNYLLQQLDGPCWIALDDVNHIKHRRSLRQMQSDARFEILVTSDEKFGFCLARFTPARVVTEPSVRKVLWARTDSIGDAVLAGSMLPHLAAKYPSAEIAVLCEKRLADLFLACPYVGSVIAFERSKAGVESHLREIVGEIERFGPDIILNSVRSRDVLSETLTLAYRQAKHIGIEADLNNMDAANRTESMSLYSRIIPSPGQHKLELARHIDFLAGLDIKGPVLQPRLWTAPQDEALAEAFFKENGLNHETTIALFPGAQHQWRVYGGYGEALGNLRGFDWLLFGTESEEPLGNAVGKALRGRVYNLCGRSGLRETAALLRRCRLYVGSESAGAHMASAMGVPNVVILGGGHFGRFMPWSPLTSAVVLPLGCFGCNWACPHARSHCVKDISPCVLTQAVQQTLERSSTRARIFLQSSAHWTPVTGQPVWKRPDAFLESVPGGVEIVEVELPQRQHISQIVQPPKLDAENLDDLHLVSAASRPVNSASSSSGSVPQVPFPGYPGRATTSPAGVGTLEECPHRTAPARFGDRVHVRLGALHSGLPRRPGWPDAIWPRATRNHCGGHGFATERAGHRRGIPRPLSRHPISAHRTAGDNLCGLESRHRSRARPLCHQRQYR